MDPKNTSGLGSERKSLPLRESNSSRPVLPVAILTIISVHAEEGEENCTEYGIENVITYT
jgi:hypothetical protein